MKNLSVCALLTCCIMILMSVGISTKDIKVVQGVFMEEVPYESYINVAGVFENQELCEVKLAYPVFIKKVYVKENSFVNKGQLLFTIDKEKMQQMVATGSIGSIDYSSITKQDILSFTSSISELASALYSLPEAIYASESGVINGLNIASDSIALPNNILCRIATEDSMMAKFTVSQTDYGKIAVGDKVVMSSVAFSDVEYTGEISSETAIVHTETTALGSKVMVDVFAKIDDPNHLIANGLQINGKIKSGDSKQIKTIDYRLIRQDDQGEYVFVLENGKAKKYYIDIGLEYQDRSEILTGFTEGTVFLHGDIKEGDSVIVNEVSYSVI